ncbi:unnamed protein product [Effrenium voratum]|uniref:Glutathione S-transferase n=1 Tax=Effrenium voratum TaxID=2562239 RepID=A0AA36MW65_9DINO|nr:unnamed protein product [Effrenium voratum]CAJ1437125.1 unnamed protein product [Effrenium voratum]
MAEMVLYHMNGARSSRAVWMHRELQAIYGTLPPLEVHAFDPKTFRENKPDWYLKINPNGKVPSFTHGQVKMYESSAICLYLLQMFDKEGKLAPLNDPEFAAKFYQLAFYCSGTVDNLTATSSPIQPVMSCLTPGEEEETVKMNHRAWQEQCGPILVSALGDSKFIFGDRFTAIDVIVGTNMHYIYNKRGWRDFPVLEAYFERLKERPTFQEAFGNFPIA